MKRSSPYVIPPIVKYGIQIDKNAKLIDLLTEIEILAKISLNKMLLVEVFNNKIYKIYDDLNMNLRQIHRRTHELFVFEWLAKIQDFHIQPKRLMPIVSTGQVDYL